MSFSALISPKTYLSVLSSRDYSIIFHIFRLYARYLASQLRNRESPSWSRLTKLIAGLSANHLTRINNFLLTSVLRLKSFEVQLLLLFFDLFLKFRLFFCQKFHQIGVKLDLADKWLVALSAAQGSDACGVTCPKVHWIEKECVIFIARGHKIPIMAHVKTKRRAKDSLDSCHQIILF